MERIGRSGQVEGEGETRLWWKWICTLLVLLSYSVLVVLWIPGKLSSVKAPRAFVLDDQAIFSAFNLSSSLTTISTACENFLLRGEKENQGERERPEKVPIQGWSDGEWHKSSDCHQHPIARSMGGSVGDHGASFSVNPATRGWSEWSSSSQMTPVGTVEGVLELKNFWDWNPSTEAIKFAEASGAKIDFNQMLAVRNLKVFLKGALVDTSAGRRLCMTGCAYRIDHSHQLDCGFHLKMTYPNRHATSSTQQIQAELSSTSTRADRDALQLFPAVRIHKDIATAEYTSRVTYVHSVLKLNNVNYNAHLRRPSTIDAAQLANFRQDYDDDTYSGYH